MDKKTLKALEGDIKKWQKIVSGKGIDDGWHNCLLCQLFLPLCIGCPVRVFTTYGGCCDTPYDRRTMHHQKRHPNKSNKYKVKCEICKIIALDELRFLKGLLPKNKGGKTR